jgi:hypothetical protein
MIGGRGVERLGIGVRNDKVDALDVRLHHVGDGVAAGSADADDADPRAEFVDFRPDEINAHDLIPPSCGNALTHMRESLNHPESQAKRKCCFGAKKLGMSRLKDSHAVGGI